MKRLSANDLDDYNDELVVVELGSSPRSTYRSDFDTETGDHTHLLGRRIRSIGSTINQFISEYNYRHPRICVSMLTFFVCCLPLIITTFILSEHKSDSLSQVDLNTNSVASKFYVESNIAVVATDVGACSDLGKNILAAGGNAMDGAITASLCLGVLNPASSGLGGGCYIMNYDASKNDVTFIDSRETAGEHSSPHMFDSDHSLALYGGLAVAVIGELKGLYLAWENHGSHILTWKQLVSPVINLANKFPVSPELHVLMTTDEEHIKSGKYPELAKLLLTKDGELKQPGHFIRRPQLAQTLTMIAEHGSSYLYDTMAATLASEIQQAGGTITEQDIRSYKPIIHKPIKTEVFGYVYYGASGSSSGSVAVASAMKYMSGFATPLASQSHTLYYHHLAEAMKHVFAMRMSLGDPLFVNSSEVIQAMLDDNYMNQLRQTSSDTSVLSTLDKYGGIFNMTRAAEPRIDSGTSHISIVDKWGNAVSLTSTINTYFGSQIVSPSTGIIFNNEMDDFSNFNTGSNPSFFNLANQPNNYPEPGKRPLSSMAPSFLFTKLGQLKMVGGASGGPRIITATLQMYLNIIGKGMNLLAALLMPRIHTQLLPNELCVESYNYISGVDINLPIYIQKSLENKNHTVKQCNMFGYSQFIVVDTDTDSTSSSSSSSSGSSDTSTTPTRKLMAVSDPRKDGRPAGL